MHLIFAVHTGKASLVTVAGRLIDMAEAEGFEPERGTNVKKKLQWSFFRDHEHPFYCFLKIKTV